MHGDRAESRYKGDGEKVNTDIRGRSLIGASAYILATSYLADVERRQLCRAHAMLRRIVRSKTERRRSRDERAEHTTLSQGMTQCPSVIPSTQTRLDKRLKVWPRSNRLRILRIRTLQVPLHEGVGYRVDSCRLLYEVSSP